MFQMLIYECKSVVLVGERGPLPTLVTHHNLIILNIRNIYDFALSWCYPCTRTAIFSFRDVGGRFQMAWAVARYSLECLRSPNAVYL